MTGTQQLLSVLKTRIHRMISAEVKQRVKRKWDTSFLVMAHATRLSWSWHMRHVFPDHGTCDTSFLVMAHATRLSWSWHMRHVFPGHGTCDTSFLVMAHATRLSWSWHMRHQKRVLCPRETNKDGKPYLFIVFSYSFFIRRYCFKNIKFIHLKTKTKG